MSWVNACCKAAGLIPRFVCATIGTTSPNAVNPIRKIGEICRQHNVWLHMDSTMSGTAALCPEFRWINDGVEFLTDRCTNGRLRQEVP